MALQLSAARMSNLIGLIYDCAVDPKRWEIALAAICHEYRFRTGILSANSFHPVQVQLFYASGLPAEWVARLPNYMASAIETYGGPRRILDFPTVDNHCISPMLRTKLTVKLSPAARTGVAVSFSA